MSISIPSIVVFVVKRTLTTDALVSSSVCFDILNNTLVYNTPSCNEECFQVYQNCVGTLMVWYGPMLLSVAIFVLSCFATFIQSDSAMKDLSNFAKLWVLLMIALWITVSLNGSSNMILDTAVTFSLAVFVGSSLVLAASQSKHEFLHEYQHMWTKLTDKYGGWFDVARGLLLFSTLPVVLLYVVLSFINQILRRLACLPCSKKIDKHPIVQVDNHNNHHNHNQSVGWLTKKTQKQYNIIKQWN